MLSGVLSAGGNLLFLSCHVYLYLCWPFSPHRSQVPLQLPSPSGCTGHIEETSSMRRAQLSWSPAKWRMASDAIGTRTEGDMQDLPPAKTPPVVNGGAVAAERSPPVCEGELFGFSSPSVRLRWNGYTFSCLGCPLSCPLRTTS